jgi:hypothetical protein
MLKGTGYIEIEGKQFPFENTIVDTGKQALGVCLTTGAYLKYIIVSTEENLGVSTTGFTAGTTKIFEIEDVYSYVDAISNALSIVNSYHGTYPAISETLKSIGLLSSDLSLVTVANINIVTTASASIYFMYKLVLTV